MRIDKFSRPPRQLRVREFTQKAPKKTGKKTSRDNKSRFVGPYYFQAEKQAAITALLAQQDIGDKEGRTLFTSALEYEIASFRQENADTPAATPNTRTQAAPASYLNDIRAPTLELLQALERARPVQREKLLLNLTASDHFERKHDERYLERLALELDHLVQACGNAEPEVSATEKRTSAFIAQFVRIYQECLEVRMSPDQYDVVIPILSIIREAAELDISTDPDTLREQVAQAS